MEFNTNTVIIYFTLVILVILVIYILVRLKKNRENFDVTNNNNNAAINNLGNIAASIMNTTTGTLTIPADTTVFTGSLTATALSQSFIDLVLPSGIILSYNSINVPAGWALCDGTNGTPNLLGRFILGAGQGGNDMNNNPLPLQTLGSIGGEVNHTLVITEMPSHMHTSYGITGGSNRWTYPGDGNSSGSSNAGNTSNTGGDPANNNATVPHNNMPPYYVLVYIIKL